MFLSKETGLGMWASGGEVGGGVEIDQRKFDFISKSAIRIAVQAY